MKEKLIVLPWTVAKREPGAGGKPKTLRMNGISFARRLREIQVAREPMFPATRRQSGLSVSSRGARKGLKL